MTIEVGGMIGVGIAALIAGLVLVRPRFLGAAGADKVIVLGPVFEACALAMFAAEHFTAARDLVPIVPHWLPAPLFWTYLVARRCWLRPSPSSFGGMYDGRHCC